MPAWALQVAADVAGTTVQALLDGDDRSTAPPDDWRAQVEDAIGRLESEMIEVRQRVGLPWQGQQSDETTDTPDTVQRRSAN